MARAFRRLIEILEARRRRRRRLRLRRRGAAPPPTTGAAPQPSELLRLPTTGAAPQPSELLRLPTTGATPQPSELLQPPTTGAAPQPSELLQPPTTETVQERTSMISRADDSETIARLASSPHYMKYIKGGGTMNGKVRRTQKGQLVLERRILDLAVKHNQGTVLQRLHAPRVDPMMKIVRVSTSMEVKVAGWLLNSNNAWLFKVVVWGHVTDQEFRLLLQEARNEGLTLYHLGCAHN